MTQRRIPQQTPARVKGVGAEIQTAVASERNDRFGRPYTFLDLGPYYGPAVFGDGLSLSSTGGTSPSGTPPSTTFSFTGQYILESGNGLEGVVSAFSPSTTTVVSFGLEVVPNGGKAGLSRQDHYGFASTTAGSTNSGQFYPDPRPIQAGPVEITPSQGAFVSGEFPQRGQLFDLTQQLKTAGGSMTLGPVAFLESPYVNATLATPNGGAPQASFGFLNIGATFRDRYTFSFSTVIGSSPGYDTVGLAPTPFEPF